MIINTNDDNASQKGNNYNDFISAGYVINR